MTISVIIVSDRCSKGERKDLTGEKLLEYLRSQKYDIMDYMVIPDEKDLIKETLIKISNEKVNLIITSGGTGFAKRDVTPEATKEVIEKEAAGIAEFMRLENSKNTPNSFLSRGTCGILKESIILNLPGSPNGALESFKVAEPLLSHCVSLVCGEVKDCAPSQK